MRFNWLNKSKKYINYNSNENIKENSIIPIAKTLWFDYKIGDFNYLFFSELFTVELGILMHGPSEKILMSASS